MDQRIPEVGNSLSIARNIASVALAGLVVVIFIGFQPLVPITPLDPLQIPDGSPAKQLAFLSVFVLALLAALNTRSRTAFTIPLGLWLLLAWCLVSASWSVAPGITLRRFVVLSIVTVSIFYCVNVLGPRALKTMGIVLIVIVGCDWLSMLLSSNAVHLTSELDPTLVGKWHGLHGHKNTAGLVMALSFLMFLFYSPTRSRTLQILLMSLSLVFLLFTGSRTSEATLCIAAILGLGSYAKGLAASQVRMVGLVSFGTVLVLLIVLMPTYFASAADALADDSLFSGRVLIWKQVLQLASERPLLGYGYGSFWSTGELSPMMSYYYSWAFRINSAHNGYFDVLASVGIIGLLLAIVFLVLTPMYKLLRDEYIEARLKAFMLAWISFCALDNLMESSLLGVNTLWVAHMFVVALIYRQIRENLGEVPQASTDPKLFSEREPITRLHLGRPSAFSRGFVTRTLQQTQRER